MSWAKNAIAKLREGKCAIVRPRGHSMEPRIKDGQLVVIESCKIEDVKIDDVVLVTVHGNDYLHIIKAIDGKRFLIGNNKGRINGWVGFNKIHGKMRPGSSSG